MSVEIIGFDTVMPSSNFYSIIVENKLRQILRIIWSVICIAGGAYAIEKVAIAWPAVSSVSLPTYFIIVLAILYIGHLAIDFAVNAVVNSNRALSKYLVSSNDCIMFDGLETVITVSRYYQKVIEISLPNDFQIMRTKPLATLNIECYGKPINCATT